MARGTVGRVAAFAVAALLTGAPRLIAALEGPAAHRCECRAGGAAHLCDCPVCAAAARAARAASSRLPPCHAGIARGPSPERDPAPRPVPSAAPCLRGHCGGADPSRPQPGGEPYTLPGAPALPLRVEVSDVAVPRASVTAASPEPETPPPRHA